MAVLEDSVGAFVPGPRLQRAPLGSGRLSGLSFAAKDLFDVAGSVTTYGNPDWASTHPVASATAPVVTALLFAGRAGTAITAEIGLMRATDQISAMEMMAVDPIAYVATPRFLAGLIAMPLLCCVFCAMAIFGGHLVGVTWLGIDNGTFWSNMTAQVDVHTDIVNGVLLKSLAFGAVVSLIAVFQGFTTPPTSEGVAYATTRTVVASSIAILALDFVLTAFLM